MLCITILTYADHLIIFKKGDGTYQNVPSPLSYYKRLGTNATVASSESSPNRYIRDCSPAYFVPGEHHFVSSYYKITVLFKGHYNRLPSHSFTVARLGYIVFVLVLCPL